MKYAYCTYHEEGHLQGRISKRCQIVEKEIGVIFGQGPGCISRDCPLLYGGECLGAEPH